MSVPKSALVTGATGFIGKPLVRALIAEGWRVTAGLRAGSRTPSPAGIAGEIHFDLTAADPISLPPGVDTIFHLAGKAHALAEVSQDDAEYTRVNTDGTRRLLEGAQRAGVRAFVYFSSIKAAGPPPRGVTAPLDEDSTTEPETAYGRSKAASETLVLQGNHVAHPVVIRPSVVYGPGVKGNIEKMISAVRNGRFPPLPESGNRRSMVHVDDVCRAAILAATHSAAAGRAYILTDGESVSTRKMFEWICAAVGRSVPRWNVPRFVLRLLARTGDGIGRVRGRRFVFDSDALAKLTESAWYSSARIERELGWRPQHSLQTSLPEIVGEAERGAKR